MAVDSFGNGRDQLKRRQDTQDISIFLPLKSIKHLLGGVDADWCALATSTDRGPKARCGALDDPPGAVSGLK